MPQMPFWEMMKLPMNIGSAVIEGGQVGLKGGDPLKATAAKIEAALKPLALFPMGQGGQLPALPMMGSLQEIPAQLMAPLQQIAPPMMLPGKEYVGQKQTISQAKDVMTTIF